MKISIITASYNNIDTIEDTIRSVISQTYTNIEYLIIDGASTDGSVDMIREKYGNSIHHFISEKDNGMYHALNKGIEMASGDVIGLLHADDIYASNDVIQKVVQTFENEKCDAVYGDLQYVYRNQSDKVLRNWKSGAYSKSFMKKGWMPPHPTLYIKKSFYRNYGLFDTNFKVAADYELMTRFLCKHNMQPAYLQKVMVKMRWGGKSNNSLGNILTKMRDDYKAIRQNGVGNIFTLLFKNLSKIQQFVKK